MRKIEVTGRDEGTVDRGRGPERVTRANGVWRYVEHDEMFNDDSPVGWFTSRKLERLHAAKFAELAPARALR